MAAHIRETASRHRNITALIDQEGPISYGQLLGGAAAASRTLQEAGAGLGSVVIISLPVCWQAYTAFLGCVSGGAIFVPVNLAWRQDDLTWLLSRVKPAAVVHHRDAERWRSAGVGEAQLIDASEFERPEITTTELTVTEVPADHPFAYMLSSGSTGRPKIVVEPGASYLRAIQNVGLALELEPGERLLAPTQFHFTWSMAFNLLLPLVTGATAVLLDPFEPKQAAAAIERYQVQYLWGSPVMFGLLIDAKTPPESLKSLRICISGGAPTSSGVRLGWSSISSAWIREGYGTTEGGTTAFQRSEQDLENCMGLPYPEKQIRILGEDDQPLPAGMQGEIAIGGPGVMTGYLDDPEATAAKFVDGFVRTGDMGWLDERGQLYVAGRIQPWINTGGAKVDPLEVQLVLQKLSGVRDCVVVPEPGPRGNDLVAATIVAEPSVKLVRADVIRHCRQHLAEYKIPQVVRFVEALSDITGKIRSKPS